MNSFKDKIAFITGGASGIGLGMAKIFSDAGMKVVIADIRQDHLDNAMASLDRTGKSIHAIRLDVTDREAMRTAAQEVVHIHGKVHLLCNNAGINLFGPIQDATYEDWDWILSVNLGGVINGVQAFLPLIRSHGEGGHIVNTASMSGLITAGGVGVYATSKFAVVGLSEALRVDLEPDNIGVSVLCPGFVNSRIYDCGKTRPKTLSKSGYAMDPKRLDRLKHVHDEIGMDRLEVGSKVLNAVQRNSLYIITHPEFRNEIMRRNNALLEAVPAEPPDHRRVAIEDSRPKINY